MTFTTLLFARFVQAFGASAGLSVALTIIGDLHPKEGTRASAGIAISFGLMSALTMLLGGLATEYLGWPNIFLFVAAYIVFIAAICFILPETGSLQKSKGVNLQKIAQALGTELKISFKS